MSVGEADRLRAYRSSRTDAEAGRRVGLSKMAFVMWRRRRGLPSLGGKKAGPPKKVLDERLQAITALGSTAEAARRLKLNPVTLYRSLKKAGLETPQRATIAQRHAEWRTLRMKGLTQAEIARKFGVSQSAVSLALRPRPHRPDA